MSAREMLTRSRGQVSAVPEGRVAAENCRSPHSEGLLQPEVPVCNLAGALDQPCRGLAGCSICKGSLEEAEASMQAEALLAQHCAAARGEVEGNVCGCEV